MPRVNEEPDLAIYRQDYSLELRNYDENGQLKRVGSGFENHTESLQNTSINDNEQGVP